MPTGSRGGAVYRATIPSPLGDLVVAADDDGLTGLSFAPGPPSTNRPNEHVDALARLLDRYWMGARVELDLPLSLRGTPFQQSVWRALLTVGYGETITYAELARRVRAPRAVRAVGRANGANPLSIVIPCHRVVGSNGSLTGYGGGLDRKRALLDLEAGVTRGARGPRRPDAPSARTARA